MQNRLFCYLLICSEIQTFLRFCYYFKLSWLLFCYLRSHSEQIQTFNDFSYYDNIISIILILAYFFHKNSDIFATFYTNSNKFDYFLLFIYWKSITLAIFMLNQYNLVLAYLLRNSDISEIFILIQIFLYYFGIYLVNLNEFKRLAIFPAKLL